MYQVLLWLRFKSFLLSSHQKLYASRNDDVGGSPSQTAAGLQSETGHQPVGQCCQLHVPRHWIPGECFSTSSVWMGFTCAKLWHLIRNELQIYICSLTETNNLSLSSSLHLSGEVGSNTMCKLLSQKYTWNWSFRSKDSWFVKVYKGLLCCSLAATSGPGSSHQPEGPPRRLDPGRHHPGVLSEHEN